MHTYIILINLPLPGVTPVRYIGESVARRIKEHTITDNNFDVFKHLNSSTNCKMQYTSNYFMFPDFSKAIHCLKDAMLLEAELNAYIQHLNTFLPLLLFTLPVL